MEPCNPARFRLTSESELSISRKCTEDHPVVALTTTPQRDKELKRRRLTSESTGAVNCRGGLPVSIEPTGQPDALAHDLEHALRSHLFAWSQKLVALQPKVYMNDHLIECGLCLFKYLRALQVQAAADGRFPVDYLGSEVLLLHDLIACWWMALKHCSVRTAVPNRTLMSRATNADPAMLADRELAALVGMDWEVNAVLRAHGLVE